MIRRTLFAFAAAAALILTPTVAVAAPTLTCTASPLAPVVGQPVKVDCTGGTKNQSVTLNIDGVASQTKNLNSKGVGAFSVRFIAAGTHTVTTSPASSTLTFNVQPKYPAQGFTFTVSHSTPAPGVPFTANLTGGPANTAIILTVTSKVTSISNVGMTIAGTKSFSVMRDANSAAVWKVTLTESGAYTLVATNIQGVVRGTQTVTVDAVPAAPAATVGSLSRTGFDPKGLLINGGLLLLAGAGAVAVARRRRSPGAAA